MKDRNLEAYLWQSLQQEVNQPVSKHDGNSARLEETVRLCIGVMRKQREAEKLQEEQRTGFAQYLSDVFRYDGMPVLALHAAVLFLICMILSTAVNNPGYIPVFMPLFVLSAMPAMFRCQYYGMSEIEAATRASGAQIILAKLILAGAVNLVCITILISFEVYLQSSCKEIGRMILYCLVPYLVCMACVLRLIRLCRKENMQISTVFVLSSCMLWGVLAKTMPWLYETSALGVWLAAFLFFAAFFIKEIYFIITMRKEGKMYGIIA